MGFGVYIPSGVIFAGALLTLRDVLHERLGSRMTLVIIFVSAPVIAITTSPALAAASAITYLLAEIIDFYVYRSLRSWNRLVAVAASNVVSSLLDSAIFLSLAFGSAAVASGTLTMSLGKLIASFLTLALLGLGSRIIRGQPSEKKALPN